MPASKAQQKAVNKYIKGNYDGINVTIPKGRKSAVEAVARKHGKSVNGYVNALIRSDMEFTEQEWKEVEA